MIEKCLIEHCAPTLASLKAANLFNACCEEEENIDLQISMWNQLMNPKGVKLLALRSRGNRSLVYVYREKQLAQNGIFLDYPLGDVIGFIQNGGQNYKCSGCWKVYCNECEALKMFQKYHKCREVYRNLWAKGRSVLQLTVAA